MAQKYNINYIETSAKSNINVMEAFFRIAKEVIQKRDKGEGVQKEKDTNNKTPIQLDQNNVNNNTKDGCC